VKWPVRGLLVRTIIQPFATLAQEPILILVAFLYMHWSTPFPSSSPVGMSRRSRAFTGALPVIASSLFLTGFSIHQQRQPRIGYVPVLSTTMINVVIHLILGAHVQASKRLQICVGNLVHGRLPLLCNLYCKRSKTRTGQNVSQGANFL
jgi:hypothetical protein